MMKKSLLLSPILFSMALFIVHCGENGPEFYPIKDPPKSQQGSRLKRLYTEWITTDGLQAVEPNTSFWDEQLKIKCSFQIAEDGQTRCLPINNDNAAFIESPSLFLDPRCTQQFVVSEPFSCAERSFKYNYALLKNTEPTSCSSGIAVFQFESQRGGTNTLYQISGGTCKEVDSTIVDNLTAGKIVIGVTNKIPPEQFVAAQTGTYQYP